MRSFEESDVAFVRVVRAHRADSCSWLSLVIPSDAQPDQEVQMIEGIIKNGFEPMTINKLPLSTVNDTLNDIAMLRSGAGDD